MRNISVIKSLLKLATVTSLVGAAIVLSPLATMRAEALTETQVLERLNGIPVFTITDEKGTPLLGSLPKQANSPDSDKQLLLFFLSPNDAQKMVDQIKTSNPAVGGKAKIIIRSMNDAYQVIKSNTEKKIAFQIIPDKASIDSARTILSSQGKPADQLPNVPVFFAIGGKDKQEGLLTLEQDGKQLVPFFFDQKDLQGLIDRAKGQQPDIASTTKIQVTSLFQVLDSMITDANKPNPDAERFTFVPSRQAFEYTVKNQPQSAQPPQAQPKVTPSNQPKVTPSNQPKVTPSSQPKPSSTTTPRSQTTTPKKPTTPKVTPKKP